jgi:prophage tail gpP-like protein
MNALINIQAKANVIVEQLADKQINEMLARKEAFVKWCEQDGNVLVRDMWNGPQQDIYGSTEKYVYLTQHRTWNRDTQQYELPTHYVEGYNGSRRQMGKDEINLVAELKMMLSKNWMDNYREQFIGANMMKLNRALAKHVHDNMTAENIKVNVGGDGAEVTADVDGMKFKTFGTLCGGWVQCYHYRYRSSLK